MSTQRKLNFKRSQSTGRRARIQTRNVPAILLLLFSLTGVLAKSNHAQYGAVTRQPSVQSDATQHHVASKSNLPLTFVPNAGQAESQVRFSAQGGGATFYFTPTEAAFSLMTNSRSGLALRLSFLGALPQTVLASAKPRDGKVNYLIGRNPNKWRTGLPTYEEIVYQHLWPGIDLRFRGENGELKYEFHLAPGADPRKIQLAYRGVEQISLGSGGELQIHTAYGMLRDSITHWSLGRSCSIL